MTSAASNAAGRDSRKRVLFAGTMVCAVGAATTLSNPFDFFSFSTSNPAVGAAKKAGGGLRASSQNFQRRLELASAEYTSGGVGDAPEDIVNFLSKFGLEMKDLELLAQLKGVQVDETKSTSESEPSTSSTAEESPDGDDASTTHALSITLLADPSDKSLATTEGGGDTSSEDEAKSSGGGFLSSFLGSSKEETTEEASEANFEVSDTTAEASASTEEVSAIKEESAATEEASTEEVPATTEKAFSNIEEASANTEEVYIEETATGSASPLDLTSLMSSYVAETENENEAEADSQPEEPLSLESLISSSTTTAEPPPEDDASPEAMMMQMMASGGMTPEQQQQLMEVMGQTARGD